MFVRKYVSGLKVSLLMSSYTECNFEWRELDYIPRFNKFYYILDGEGWLRIDGKDIYPKPGYIYLMPSGVKQSFSYINENRFKKYWCHFTSKIGDIELFDMIKTPLYVKVRHEEKLTDLFMQLIEAYKSEVLTATLSLNSRLLDIITFFLDSCEAEGQVELMHTSSTSKLDKVIKYVESNLSSEITLDSLAKIAHFHPNYFIRFFKKHTGLSPMHYINNMRMEKAKYLLKLHDMSITEIARKTGFNEVSHFSRTFKSSTGFSPLKFRKIGIE